MEIVIAALVNLAAVGIGILAGTLIHQWVSRGSEEKK